MDSQSIPFTMENHYHQFRFRFGPKTVFPFRFPTSVVTLEVWLKITVQVYGLIALGRNNSCLADFPLNSFLFS